MQPIEAESEGHVLELRRVFGAVPAIVRRRHIRVIGGVSAAILPNGRLVTPAGVEVECSGAEAIWIGAVARRQHGGNAQQRRRPLLSDPDLPAHEPVTLRSNGSMSNASFMGVTFSPDSTRLYLSGGENGNIWVADAVAGQIIGSVNLNGATHPLDRPLDVVATPALRFKGAFPGNMALTSDGRFLYVVDQGELPGARGRCDCKIVTGVDAQGKITEPDNFAAVVARVEVGRYPFGIGLSPRRSDVVRHQCRRVPVHAPPAGEPHRRRQRRLSALLSGRRLSRRDAQRPASSRSTRSIRAICPTASAIPMASGADTYPPTGLHRSRARQPQRAASLRRSTCSTSATRRARSDSCDREDRAAASDSARTGSMSTAAATRTPSSSARRRSTSPMATTTASRSSIRARYAGTRPHRACRCCAVRIAR